jgi:hypothetical protein
MAAFQAMMPCGAIVNETATLQAMTPFGMFINERASVQPTLGGSALTPGTGSYGILFQIPL